MNKKKPYYIFQNDNYQQVRGRCCKIKGFEEYDFFLHYVRTSRSWVISEGKTGLVVGSAHRRSMAEVMEMVKNLLDNRGKGSLDNAIESGIKHYGLSPRYGE